MALRAARGLALECARLEGNEMDRETKVEETARRMELAHALTLLGWYVAPLGAGAQAAALAVAAELGRLERENEAFRRRAATQLH